MSQANYQCLDCNHSFKGRQTKYDGTYFPKCNGRLVCVEVDYAKGKDRTVYQLKG